jgi:hypothetical protein
MPEIPRPNIEAKQISPDSDYTKVVEVTVTRADGKTSEVYVTRGNSVVDIARDAVREVLDRPNSAEYIHEDKVKR